MEISGVALARAEMLLYCRLRVFVDEGRSREAVHLSAPSYYECERTATHSRLEICKASEG